MITLLTEPEVEILCKDDPVRPHLEAEFRVTDGREVFALYEDGIVTAVCCVAYLYDVPKEEKDLVSLSMHGTPDPFDADCPEGYVIVPYTIWSYSHRAGTRLLKELLETIRVSCQLVKPRVVTLSPITDLAKKFHESNGALMIKQNAKNLNFEYFIFNKPETATVYDLDYFRDKKCSK
jgi:hypothetical protein